MDSFIQHNCQKWCQNFAVFFDCDVFQHVGNCFSFFLPSPFLAPGFAFWAVWKNKNCSVQTDILQRLHADLEGWSNLLWVLADDTKNVTGLMVVIHIYYVLNYAIKLTAEKRKCAFLTLALCSMEVCIVVVYTRLIASERRWPVQTQVMTLDLCKKENLIPWKYK